MWRFLSLYFNLLGKFKGTRYKRAPAGVLHKVDIPSNYRSLPPLCSCKINKNDLTFKIVPNIPEQREQRVIIIHIGQQRFQAVGVPHYVCPALLLVYKAKSDVLPKPETQ